MNIKLKGNYTDIRILRKIKGYSIKELAALIPISESYLNQLEKGTKNIYLDMYNRIIEILGFNIKSTIDIELSEILQPLQSKGRMYKMNSIKEIAKQQAYNYLEKNKTEWELDSITAVQKLISLLDKKEPSVTINSTDYAVYDGTDGGNYELQGQTFHIDTSTLAHELVNNTNEFFEALWSVPTIEGPRPDIFLLLN